MSLIIDPNETDFEALKRQYNAKQTGQACPLFDQVKDAVMVSSGDPNERIPKISPKQIQDLIPTPETKPQSKIPVRKHKWHAHGTAKKYEKKLHCFSCGKKRLMKVATTALNLNGSIDLVYLKLRRLLKTLHEDKHVQLPEVIIGNCFTCYENTFYRVVKGKLVVSQEIEAQVTDEIVREIAKAVKEQPAPEVV